MLSEHEVLEAIAKEREQLSNWSLAAILEEAQSDNDIWEALCVEIDRDDQFAAASFLKGLIELGDLVEMQGESFFVAMVALHNVCGCMEALERKVPVPCEQIAAKIPCTHAHFRIVSHKGNYKLAFVAPSCQYISETERQKSDKVGKTVV